MKVLVITDYYNQGGAGIAASRLVRYWQRQEDVTVSVLSGHPPPEDSLIFGVNFVTLTLSRKLTYFLNRLRRIRLSKCAYFLQKLMMGRLIRKILKKDTPDIINVHNIHGSPWSLILFSVLQDLPVVWTLHDMWSFTGRCAYSYNCRKFIHGCDSDCDCPDDYPSVPECGIKRSWAYKKELIRNHVNLHAVTPSNWLMNEAKEGLWKERSVHVIANGLPLDIFHPYEKQKNRLQHGLKTEGTYVLMVAESLKEHRKGAHLLPLISSLIKEKEVYLLTMGRDAPEIVDKDHQFNFGYVSDENKKALIYSMSDLLIHPAPVDNLPNVVAEAIACGTPAIAFNTGGLSDLIVKGKTGWLAEASDMESFNQLLFLILEQLPKLKLVEECSSYARERLNMEVQGGLYVKLFKRLLELP